MVGDGNGVLLNALWAIDSESGNGSGERTGEVKPMLVNALKELLAAATAISPSTPSCSVQCTQSHAVNREGKGEDEIIFLDKENVKPVEE